MNKGNNKPLQDKTGGATDHAALATDITTPTKFPSGTIFFAYFGSTMGEATRMEVMPKETTTTDFFNWVQTKREIVAIQLRTSDVVLRNCKTIKP
jgi:hypothetical protein